MPSVQLSAFAMIKLNCSMLCIFYKVYCNSNNCLYGALPRLPKDKSKTYYPCCCSSLNWKLEIWNISNGKVLSAYSDLCMEWYFCSSMLNVFKRASNHWLLFTTVLLFCVTNVLVELFLKFYNNIYVYFSLSWASYLIILILQHFN